MKINAEICERGVIVCREECFYKQSCANHSTAGDFRAEDGFTPELFEENGVIFCNSKNKEPALEIKCKEYTKSKRVV